jgi:hypothetical protein
MLNELDQRESRVMDFINSKNKETSASTAYDALNASPEIKLRKLNDETQKGKSICIDTILGRLYKDALPFDDPKKNCSDDEARDEIRNFIANRTGGKNSEYYVREAIKKTNSSALKNLLTEAENISKSFYKEKAKDIGTINLKDLNFNMNVDDEGISKITKKLELDEISDIIHNNVQKAIQDEADKAKREEEYNKEIEDALAADPNVQDDASMESAIEKMNVAKQPTIYQPSLFESILLNKAGVMKESTGENIMSEAVHEYTLLNIAKALRLERFTVESVRQLANKYAAA